MACNPEVLKTVDDDHQEAIVSKWSGATSKFRSNACRMLEWTVRPSIPRVATARSHARGERTADAVARFGGSWSFIIAFGVVLSVYTAINVGLRGAAWDPYPFILLNLFLSMLAAIQAPVIMMSQNRQDKKDRVRSELDFDVNRRAESEIQGVARKLNLLGEKLGDLEDLLREKLSREGPPAVPRSLPQN